MSKEFTIEAEMCRAFLDVLPRDWVSFNETWGWDMLLVRKQDGFQIGIQAKLRLNDKVLAQTAEKYSSSATRPGPDCRAVLVPNGGLDLGAARYYLPFTIMRVWVEEFYSSNRRARFDPVLPIYQEPSLSFWGEEWFELCPVDRHKLPDYVPDVEAGARSPLQLTPGKIGAIKIAVTLERNGFVTRQNFSHYRVDHRRWIAPALRWIEARDGRFVRGPLLPDFKTIHPQAYAAIAADWEKWATEAKPKMQQLKLV